MQHGHRETHAFHCNLHLMSTHFTCCPDYRCQKLSVRACGDLGDGRVDSEECGVGLKARVRRQIPSPPAALQWTWLSISLRPVSSFALPVFPNSCCLSLLSFFCFLLLQVKVPTGLGLFDEDGNMVWFVITLP